MLIPSSFPQHHPSHQKLFAVMTRRDRKPHQQGGLLLWEQPLRRIKGSQLLTLEEGTGAQGGELVQDAVASLQKKKKKKPQAWSLASFLSPAHGLFLSRQGRGHLVGLFRNRVQPHSGKALSSQLEPHVQGELGVAKQQPRFNPPRLRDSPAFKTAGRNKRTELSNCDKETFSPKYS